MTKASVSNIKFYPDKEINKILTMKLSACDYVNDHLNVIVVGATGSGKMYYICIWKRSMQESYQR